MPYGTIKVDNITFDNGGTDKLITVSGLFFSTSGALTVTGTISGGNVTAPTATFTTLTGTTTAGTTATFTSGSFTSLTGVTTTVTSGVFGLGSAAAPSIAFSGDTNNGIYSPGADQVAISTSGTQRLTVDTAATTSTLPVVHPLGAVGTPSITFTGDLNTGIYSPAADTLAFVEGGAEAMRIDSSGNVGIGTASPGRKLHVAGSAVFSDTVDTTIWAQFSSGVGGIGTNSNYPFAFATNGTERMRLTSAGLLGLGTSSPGSLLDLRSASAPSLHISTTGYTPDYRGYSIDLSQAQQTGGINFTISSPSAFLDLYAGGSASALGGWDGQIRFFTGGTNAYGTERARIDSSGRVGIGTSSPTNTAGFSQQLQLTGNLPCISIDNTGTGANKYSLGVNSAGALGFWDNTASAFRMYINSSGNVGIGTTGPTIQLQVLKDPGANNANNGAINLCRTSTVGSTLYHTYSTAVSDEVFAFSVHGSTTFSDTTYTKYLASAGGVHVWYGATTATERARIDSSGRLLVGTSSARTDIGSNQTAAIQTESTVNGLGYFSAFNQASSYGSVIALAKSRGTSVGSNTIVQSGDQIGGVYFYGADGVDTALAAGIDCYVDGTPGSNDMPGRLVFSTTADGAASPTERMRITSTGQILIGTTSTTGLGGGSSVNQGVQIGVGIVSSQRNDTANNFWAKATGYTSGDFTAHYVNNTYVGGISTNGSTTTYATASDYRLKENIVPVTGSIVRFQQLKPRRFNFIGHSQSTVDGFLAHEVQQIVPEAVVGEKDATNEDGTIKPQGIDQSKLVPLLTAALQEAIGEIESLKARLTAAGI